MEARMVCISALLLCTLYQFVHGDGALLLTEENFDHSIQLSPHFIMFFAPWCGHCKRLLPTWDELAQKYADAPESITIAKVDCTADTSTNLCARNNVQGYPTIKFFNGDENKRYTGKRTLEELGNFVDENIKVKKVEVEMDNGLASLTADNFDEYIKRGLHFVEFYAPWCGHCKQLEPIWKELGAYYKDNEYMSISRVDCTANSGKCGQNDVLAFPTLLMFKNGFKIGAHNGDRSFNSLLMYTQEIISRHRLMKTEGTKSSEVKPTTTQEELPTTVVPETPPREIESVSLGSENFQSFVAAGTSFVKFYAPWCGHCQLLAPTWKDLANKCSLISDGPKIAKVDCTAESGICSEHGITGYPTLKIFQNGEVVGEYSGSRDLDSLYGFVMRHFAQLDSKTDDSESVKDEL